MRTAVLQQSQSLRVIEAELELLTPSPRAPLPAVQGAGVATPGVFRRISGQVALQRQAAHGGQTGARVLQRCGIGLVLGADEAA